VTKYLGLSQEHDASIAVVEEGRVTFFCKEERITGRKRDSFPTLALSKLNIQDDDVTFVYSSPVSSGSPTFSAVKFIASKTCNITKSFDISDEHHLTHANLAFYDSGFEKALVVVIDRNGSLFAEAVFESESIYVASYPNVFTPIYKSFWMQNDRADSEIRFLQKLLPDCEVVCKSKYGITKVYESATSLILQHALENGKVMGLSAYGDKTKPFPNLFVDKVTPNDSYFSHDYVQGLYASVSSSLQKDAVKEVPQDSYQMYADYSWQVQSQTQEAVAELIRRAIERTGLKNVCITGGYGLNVVANHFFITEFPDVNFFFEPIADDSGNSIGAAMKLYRDTTLDTSIHKLEHTFFNGFKYSLDGIEGVKTTTEEVALLLSQGKSVAVYQGLAEAGPRALGNRSILFDPRNKDAKKIINRVKKREWYRPFAGMVLKEDARTYFDMGRLDESPFMTISFPVTPLGVEVVPGVVHVDNTCRLQTIDKSNLTIHDLITAFKSITGVGVLLNTSFNLAGKPLVETPDQAFATLRDSDLDYVWFPEAQLLVQK
jgi:carbamoyltransferase